MNLFALPEEVTQGTLEGDIVPGEITRALSFPGLQIQRITTREPDASQIECAIAALKPCIPDNLEEDEW